MRSAAAAALLATLAVANPVPGDDKHKADGYLSVKSMPSCQAVCISENLCYLGEITNRMVLQSLSWAGYTLKKWDRDIEGKLPRILKRRERKL